MPDADARSLVLETAPPDAAAECRRAEALLPRGQAAEAIECCRRAWPSVGDDPSLLRICGWVFSNAACHAEAAAAYRRLLELCPQWVEGHRHLSAALAAAGRAEAAIAPAMTASDRAPDQPEFALHAAQLLVAAQRREEAAGYIDRAMARAAGEPRLVADAAELLMGCGRAGAAAALLADADSGDARLLRVLSAAEMVCGRPDAALAAIDRALGLAPDNAEYHLHRGHLLWRLDDLAGAAQAFHRALACDPDAADARRAQVSLYLAAGLVREATAAGGDLLRRHPDDRGSAEAVLHVLNHRLDTLDGEAVVAPGAAREPQLPRPAPALNDRLRTQRRVIRALIIRETRTRFAEYKLGYGWALIEPILHIALLSAMFAVLMHGSPPIGRNFFLFYYTGLIPYLMFVHTSSGMSHAITGNAPLLQLPPVTSFDAIAARGLLEIMTDIIVATILLAGFIALGWAQMPDDLWGPSMALCVAAVLGCGLGFANAVMTAFWRSWEKAYNQLTRVLYFISGIFYAPAMMPDWARHLLAWNPLLQAIEWFRAGFFASYRPHWLDRRYLVVVAILALLSGLSLHRFCCRRLSVPL
ncbi:MAG TPA: ABC transporter permease [Stellaceae bacterium]|nr:ABC transporter permease [Stellaceae bacterium]